MTTDIRSQAIALARKHAAQDTAHSYTATAEVDPTWEPHEWVIEAISEQVKSTEFWKEQSGDYTQKYVSALKTIETVRQSAALDRRQLDLAEQDRYHMIRRINRFNEAPIWKRVWMAIKGAV